MRILLTDRGDRGNLCSLLIDRREPDGLGDRGFKDETSCWPGRKARTSPHIPGRKHEHPLLIRRDLIKMPKALRAEINDVVVKYAERKLRKDGSLDVAMMAHEMTQSLVDMIVEQEEHHHAPLFALMILSLGDEYLKRTGNAERRDN
jgi:hypothetical protein